MTATDAIADNPRCRGCRHLIRSAESLATGYGKGCRAKMRRTARSADLSAWTSAQIEDAQQAIEDGAAVPSSREGMFHVVSSDGSEIYRTHANGCTCANGLLTRPARPCWHRAAVVIILGAPAGTSAKSPLALPAAPATGASPAGDVWAALEAAGALDLIPAF